MPTYNFRCSCGHDYEIVLSMKSIDTHSQKCNNCGKEMKQVITSAGRAFFQRSPFPTEFFEHADYEPRKFRDKIELSDHCESVGLRSRLLEDGDVPL